MKKSAGERQKKSRLPNTTGDFFYLSDFGKSASRSGVENSAFLTPSLGGGSLSAVRQGEAFLFFLKRHFTIINRLAHRYAVDIHTADDGFRSEPGFVAYTAFNWLFEDVLYQTSGHVAQIDTGINQGYATLCILKICISEPFITDCSALFNTSFAISSSR